MLLLNIVKVQQFCLRNWTYMQKENMGYKKFEMQHHHREGNKVEDSLPTGDKDTKRESSEHYKACLNRQEHC